MKTLRFHGSSDDLFVEETTESELCNNASGKPLIFKVKSPSGGCWVPEGLYVWGVYDLQPNPFGRNPYPTPASWMVGVQQIDENIPIPLWPMRLSTHENDYSVLLEIDAPDDVVVVDACKSE